MKRLASVEELVNFRRRILSERSVQYDTPTLVVCAGTGGQASGANDIIRVIKRHLIEKGHEVKDFGTYSPEACDYPDFIYPAALAVGRGECDRAVVMAAAVMAKPSWPIRSAVSAAQCAGMRNWHA